MGTTYHNKPIVTDGLVFCVDAANKNSFGGTVASPGTLWSDIIGTNNGTIVNGVSFDTSFGGFIGFDSTSDYVETNLSINGDSAASYDVWFKTASPQLNKYLISSPRSSTGNGFDIRMTSDGIESYLSNGSTVASCTMDVTYGDDKFHHVVSAYNGSNLTLYFNGVLKDTTSKTGTIAAEVNKFYIGSFYETSYSGLEDIACVKVYDKGLSASEVAQNYNALKNRFI